MILLEQSGVQRDGSIVTLLRAEKPGRDLPCDAGDLREAIHRHDFFMHIDKMLRRGRETDFRGVSPSPAFVVNTGGSAVALSAATAKTIMYLNAGTNYEPSLAEMSISFDGVTATAVPALCELCFGTKATNSTPGTASTSFTPLQIRGFPPKAATVAAANTCTSEPTVLTSLKMWLVSPYGGLLVVQSPLGREPTGIVTSSTSGLQVAIRCNAPAAVNVRGYMEFEE